MSTFNSADIAAFTGGVWVFCEQRQGKMMSTSYELISAGEDGKFTDAQQNSIPSSPKKEDFTESDDLTNL